jgi:hypothetical protein
MRLNCRVTKRLVLAVAVGDVLLALVAAQRRRLASTRECCPDCWCKDPGLSLFRWVLTRTSPSGMSTRPG